MITARKHLATNYLAVLKSWIGILYSQVVSGKQFFALALLCSLVFIAHKSRIQNENIQFQNWTFRGYKLKPFIEPNKTLLLIICYTTLRQSTIHETPVRRFKRPTDEG